MIPLMTLSKWPKKLAGISDREMDALLATGEQQSAALLALTLQNSGCDAISLTVAGRYILAGYAQPGPDKPY